MRDNRHETWNSLPPLHLVRVQRVLLAMKSVLEGKWRTDLCRLIRKPILAFRALCELTADKLWSSLCVDCGRTKNLGDVSVIGVDYAFTILVYRCCMRVG